MLTPSRNPINFGEADCNVINYNKFLNPNNPKDAEIISKMLEESDEGEEDEDFELYLSDDEKFDNLSADLEKDLFDEHADSMPFTQEELCESPKLQITERALIHDPPRNDRILTRSQTKSRNIDQEKSFNDSQRDENEIKEIKDRNDPPDKGSDTEDDEKTDDEEEKSVINNNENQSPRINPSIIDIQTFKNSVIETSDLLFLRKDNVAYFVDTEKPLDSGSQKLFERNDIPKLGSLDLGEAKTIKHKKTLPYSLAH